MARKATTVAALLAQEDWHEERKALRDIMRGSGLVEETVKWHQLCYMAHGGNLAMIYALKDSCGVSFFKGSLLDDPSDRLSDNGPNSVAVMRMDFTSLAQIHRDEAMLLGFVEQAAMIEQQGLSVERDESQMPDWPAELVSAFEKDDALREAFEGLTKGRQRGYLIHFTGAKSTEARARRIAKYGDDIRAGKGMHDR